MHTQKHICIYTLKKIQNLRKSHFQSILCVIKTIQNFKLPISKLYTHTHTKAICIQLLKKGKTLSISQIQITHTYLTYKHIHTEVYSKSKFHFQSIPWTKKNQKILKIPYQNYKHKHISIHIIKV